MFISRLLLSTFCILPMTPLTAHEFWIDAQEYQVAAGSAIRADFKNGEAFKGNTLSYFSRSSERFDWAMAGDVTPVEARLGDSPAFQLQAPEKDGLLVVLHESTTSTLTYSSWEKFAKFIAHKDFATAEADHTAAGWPRQGFKESYSRHVKALIGIGNGAGNDTAFGLATEFVALSNPYTQDFNGQMQVQLFYKNTPRPDAQVEVFDRAPDGAVVVTLHRTDSTGMATIPVSKGHEYLFDAVVLRPASQPGDDPKAPVWQTLWAALTFGVPQ